MGFERAFTIVCGAESATALASKLVLESAFFEVTPLPDDAYQFAVKSDRKDLLDSPNFDSMDRTGLAAWYENAVGYNPVDDDPTTELETLRSNCKEYFLIQCCGGIDTPAYQQIEAQRLAIAQ